MKTFIILSLFFVACSRKPPGLFETDFDCHLEGMDKSIPKGHTRELWNAIANLCEHKTRAHYALKLAREKHYGKPTMDEVLAINKQNVACLEQTPLALKNSKDFYKEIHRIDRVKPDSAFIKEMTVSFNHSIACFKKHNEQIKPYL